MADSKGVIYKGRTEGMNEYKAFFANKFLVGILFILLLLNPFFLMEFFPRIAFYVTNLFILLGLGLAIFYSSYLALEKFRPAYFYLAA